MRRREVKEELSLLDVVLYFEDPQPSVTVMMTVDEWVRFRDWMVTEPFPSGGFRGERFVIPPGLAVWMARTSDANAPGGFD